MVNIGKFTIHISILYLYAYMSCLGYRNLPPKWISPRALSLGHEFQQNVNVHVVQKTFHNHPFPLFSTPKTRKKNAVVFPGLFIQNSRDASKFAGGSWNNKGHWTWKRGKKRAFKLLKVGSSLMTGKSPWEDLLLKSSRVANMDWTCSPCMSTSCIVIFSCCSCQAFPVELVDP